MAEQLVSQGLQITGTIQPGLKLPPYVESLGKARGCSLVPCDLAEPAEFRTLLKSLRPSKVFHLAAISQPQECETQPDLSRAVNVTSVEVLKEWARHESQQARVLVLSSSAVYGANPPVPQSEDTPALPGSEYGRHKQQVRQIAADARSAGLYFACGIPFNHESPRRPEKFVFSKVCRSAARLALGLQQELRLGAMGTQRDWGYAPEYCEAFKWMLDVAQPLELVLATGEAHSIEELAAEAFRYAGIELDGRLVNDSTLLRPADTVSSVGDPSKAWRELGWEARTKFKDLVAVLVDAALEELRPLKT